MSALHDHSHKTSKPTNTGGCCLADCTLENALKIIVDIYHQYAPREGKDDYLSQKDLKELLQCQAPTFLSACGRSSPGYIEKLFKEADVDKNKNLTFEETFTVFALLADDAHRISHGEDRCGPDKD
ncbi:protein S100-A7-like [Heteronotia binoei]|uniref:protein S100-A7-like n=1 Tax=Heteronotia binoei TaxID=13085 RepID=UPI00292EBEE5|nr:protein S100-A7-like [Heteronotia binoei]